MALQALQQPAGAACSPGSSAPPAAHMQGWRLWQCSPGAAKIQMRRDGSGSGSGSSLQAAMQPWRRMRMRSPRQLPALLLPALLLQALQARMVLPRSRMLASRTLWWRSWRWQGVCWSWCGWRGTGC